MGNSSNHGLIKLSGLRSFRKEDMGHTLSNESNDKYQCGIENVMATEIVAYFYIKFS